MDVPPFLCGRMGDTRGRTAKSERLHSTVTGTNSPQNVVAPTEKFARRAAEKFCQCQRSSELLSYGPSAADWENLAKDEEDSPSVSASLQLHFVPPLSSLGCSPLDGDDTGVSAPGAGRAPTEWCPDAAAASCPALPGCALGMCTAPLCRCALLLWRKLGKATAHRPTLQQATLQRSSAESSSTLPQIWSCNATRI